MNKPAAVIFDLGRVLVGVDVSRGLWARILGALERDQVDTPAGREWKEIYRRFATGFLPAGEFHLEVCRLLAAEIGYSDFVEQWCDVFYTLEGMPQLFRQVAAKIPVGLLSDTDPLHWSYELERNSWLELIKKPTLSFEIGLLKPDPQAFNKAAANTGFAPEECLFIDDLIANVEGARAVGMQALQFEGVEKLRAQLVERGLI